MIFTVIAYKESGYQSYRNCITERFDSKFDSIMTDKKEDVIKFIAGKMSSESDHQEPDWDFMICINGYVAYSSGTVEGTFSNIELDTDINDDYDKLVGEIIETSRITAYALVDQRRIKEDEQKRRALQSEKEIERREEIKKLKELKAKYPEQK